jgi:hypothetical protein
VILNREADPEVILAMELAELCQGLGVLPRTGGLLDQDYYHIVLLRAGLRAAAKLQAKNNKPK